LRRWIEALRNRLLPWRTVRETGIWRYQQHARTNARRAHRMSPHGHQPLDERWLNGA